MLGLGGFSASPAHGSSGRFLTCKPISRQHTCAHLSSFSDLLSKAILKAEKGKDYKNVSGVSLYF